MNKMTGKDGKVEEKVITTDLNKDWAQSDPQKDGNNQEIKDKKIIDDEKIKNIVEKYQTPEELAKANILKDKEFTKVNNKNRDLHKRIASTDKNYLIDLYKEDPKLADSLSKELYDSNVDSIVNELWKEITKDWEVEDKRYTKEELEKQIEARLATERHNAVKEAQKEAFNNRKLEIIDNFMISNQLWEADKEKVLSTFNLLTEWKDLELDQIQSFLKISLNDYSVQSNQEFDAAKKQDWQILDSVWSFWSRWTPSINWITKEIKRIANLARKSWSRTITPERVKELQEKYWI